jgi:hypothetical protein
MPQPDVYKPLIIVFSIHADGVGAFVERGSFITCIGGMRRHLNGQSESTTMHGPGLFKQSSIGFAQSAALPYDGGTAGTDGLPPLHRPAGTHPPQTHHPSIRRFHAPENPVAHAQSH